MSGDVIADELPQGRRRLGVGVLVVFTVIAICYALDLFAAELASSISKTNSADGRLVHLGIARSVLENLMAGALAALILGLAYRSIITWIDPADRVVEITANRITERLLRNAKRSEHYTFIGNTATFVTTAVLPVLTAEARTTSRTRTITLFMIDPLDLPTVQTYRNYSNRVAQQSSKVSDATMAAWVAPTSSSKTQSDDDVIGKVLAAIYFAAYSVSMQGMTGAVYLRRAFTPFRVDLSDGEAVLTQESGSEAAVAFSARGHFYGWYQKECDALKSQCAHLDLTSKRDLLRGLLAHPSEPSADVLAALQKLLGAFPHTAPLLANANALAAATRRIVQPSHAYLK
jgi:hypothetical protein